MQFHSFLERIHFFGEDHTYEYNVDDVNNNKVPCIFAYFGILFFLPLVACRRSDYGRYHANQGLLLLLLSIIFGGFCWLLNLGRFVPFFGVITLILSGIVGFIGSSCCLSLLVYGIVNIVRGQATDLPIIGWIRIIK